MCINKLLNLFLSQVREKRPRARRCVPEINIVACPDLLKDFVVRFTSKISLCCPLIVYQLSKGIELDKTTVPHVVVRFKA